MCRVFTSFLGTSPNAKPSQIYGEAGDRGYRIETVRPSCAPCGGLVHQRRAFAYVVEQVAESRHDLAGGRVAHSLALAAC